MRNNLEPWLLAVILALILCFSYGCGAAFFSAKTEATYKISPDGKSITYVSTKEQQGLDLKLTEADGKVTAVEIHVDRASTAESAIAAAAKAQEALANVISKLIDAGLIAGKAAGS